MNIGDIVRIVRLEDLSDMQEPTRTEVTPIFAYLVGKRKRIAGFDEKGNAEITFTIRKGPHKGMHTVWVSPNILEKV